MACRIECCLFLVLVVVPSKRGLRRFRKFLAFICSESIRCVKVGECVLSPGCIAATQKD